MSNEIEDLFSEPEHVQVERMRKEGIIHETLQRLAEFREQMNAGQLREIINRHTKLPQVVSSRNLYLTPPLRGRGWIFAPDHRKGLSYIGVCGLDSNYGFGLVTRLRKTEHPVLLASMGFMYDPYEVDFEYNVLKPSRDLPAHTPVITDMQGPGRNTFLDDKTRRRVGGFLNSFHWRNVFVDIMQAWAKSEQSPGVHMLRAKDNINYLPGHSDVSIEKSLDETAQVMGFDTSGKYYFLPRTE